MRRSERLSRRTRTGLGLDLTPMVDVVFLLVIFFMVSTTFITLESGLPVDLPQAQSSQAQSSELPTVTINQDDQIFVGGSPVAEGDLVAVLREVLASSASDTVVLRADQSVRYGLPVRVMDLIKQAGAQRVAIATGGN